MVNASTYALSAAELASGSSHYHYCRSIGKKCEWLSFPISSPTFSKLQVQRGALFPQDGQRWRQTGINVASADTQSAILVGATPQGLISSNRDAVDGWPTLIPQTDASTDPGSSATGRDNETTNIPQVFLKDMSYEELETFVVRDLADDPKRARVLWTWLYRDKHWAAQASEMEGVSRSFRDKLEKHFCSFDSLTLTGVRTGRDGTRKLTFQLKEQSRNLSPFGGGVVETVLIPSSGRTTVCVSSQLGCAMGCEFCFTAKMGLQKNLSVGQIVDQLVITRRLFEEEVGQITNVVFMGMGEPLHNLDAVLAAVRVMADPSGLAVPAARISVSTSGLVPEIRRFCSESVASLAVSLNATTDKVRSRIMPINRRYPLGELLGTLRELFPRDRRQSHVFLEYIMLEGVNDSFDDAHRLLALTEGLPCKINLIVFNPHSAAEGLRPSDPAHVRAFQDILLQAGRLVFVRQSRGDDEMAACGQLGQLAGASSK
eukprot:TRINITY_DN30067_c0_g1_i1.p1 TRINITY_DN30067_c0_g1~~TRINITY_DN30067_c0_g1_i1.p1  ORF type:complete len:487 (-),score=60.32 TRINITY_DN30067_c0_g1_i1:687-2147(-)